MLQLFIKRQRNYHNITWDYFQNVMTETFNSGFHLNLGVWEAEKVGTPGRWWIKALFELKTLNVESE